MSEGTIWGGAEVTWNGAPGTERLTHAVIYDAADNHSIQYDDQRLTGCSCGFVCEEWDEDGDTLVDHLRALGPRTVIHLDLSDEATP